MRIHILHIQHIIHIQHISIEHIHHILHIRHIVQPYCNQFVKRFTFVTSETVSIASSNRLIRLVGNDDFNPFDIHFRILPAI
jgi:hypothetical protein